MGTNTFVTLKTIKEEGLLWSLDTELFFIAEGIMTLTIGDVSFDLQTGDLAIVNRFQLYSLENIHGLCLQLSMDLKQFASYCGFTETLLFHLNTANAALNPNNACYPQNELLRSLLLKLLSDIIKKDDVHPLLRKRDEFNLLTELLLHFSVPAITHPEQEHILGHALLYIAQNHTTPISVQDIALHCHISNAYLAHLFQSTLKTSPSGFLLKTRLQHAQKLLVQPLTLTQIAAASGFGNARNFNAAFRKIYGMLPSEYRKRKAELAESAPSSSLRDWITSRSMSPAISYYKTSASLNIPPAYQLPEHLLDLLEFGTASRLLHLDCQNYLRACQEQFHFRYIRLTGVFDNTLLAYIPAEDQIFWDFSSLDQILEFVLSIGLTPIITISSIPNALSPIGSSDHFGFSNVSCPTDMEKWRSLIHSFLSHLLEHFGCEELRTWKIGIWFLSSFSAIQGTGSLSAQEYTQALIPYFSLYREAFQIIRSLSPKTNIGCPEGDLEDLLNSDYILEWMFQYFKENNCFPDYFIFHDNWGILDQEFDTDRELVLERHISVAESCARTTLLCDRINRYSDMEIPVYCASWRSIHHGAPINETVFAASALTAYILKNSCCLAMIGIGPYHDFPTLPSGNTTDFRGGWGFVTEHNIRRPFYHVLLELRKLQPSVVYADNHSFITIGLGRVMIYLYNTHDFAYRLRLPRTALKRLPLEISAENYFHPGSYDPLFGDCKKSTAARGGKQLNIILQLEGLPSKSFLLEVISINASNGSAYDEWIREGAFEHFAPEDYRALADRSHPARFKKYITATNGAYCLTCTLEPSEIQVISLSSNFPNGSTNLILP